MLVKISRNPSRSLVYGYSSWAEAGDLYGLQRGDLHGLQRGSYQYPRLENAPCPQGGK